MRESARRYLGLELAGAKNQKTALAALEYYPTEKKIFLLDLYDRITPRKDPDGEQTGDEALLELIQEFGEEGAPGISRLGVNVPLELPPCLLCTKKKCRGPGKCTNPATKWMREFTKKISRTQKALEFTPYTQRPIELWIRYQVLSRMPESHRFEIDETLGGNKAPLTARMLYLKRFLERYDLVEVWPKLTVAILAQDLEIDKRVISRYRHLEEGVHAREEILETLAEAHGIFIYERDIIKLANSLSSFDAFICAYTALLSDNQRCAKVPPGFPRASGWVEHPLC